MAQTTTYTCDRCKNSAIDDPRFLVHVRVDCGDPYSQSGYSPAKTAGQMWCADCLVSMGLIWPSNIGRDNATAPIPPPTLEEVIRDIIRDEVEAATGARS